MLSPPFSLYLLHILMGLIARDPRPPLIVKKGDINLYYDTIIIIHTSEGFFYFFCKLYIYIFSIFSFYFSPHYFSCKYHDVINNNK